MAIFIVFSLIVYFKVAVFGGRSLGFFRVLEVGEDYVSFDCPLGSTVNRLRKIDYKYDEELGTLYLELYTTTWDVLALEDDEFTIYDVEGLKKIVVVTESGERTVWEISYSENSVTG